MAFLRGHAHTPTPICRKILSLAPALKIPSYATDCKFLVEVLWWRFMLSIHLEVKDFGNEDETNYETDEINKENMKEFCIFIADQKS